MGELEGHRLLLGAPLCPLNVPGGCRALHASTAFVNRGRGVSRTTVRDPTDREARPIALGSGKSLTPLPRMQSANFTAFSYSGGGVAAAAAAYRCCWSPVRSNRTR